MVGHQISDQWPGQYQRPVAGSCYGRVNLLRLLAPPSGRAWMARQEVGAGPGRLGRATHAERATTAIREDRCRQDRPHLGLGAATGVATAADAQGLANLGCHWRNDRDVLVCCMCCCCGGGR